MSFDVNGVTIPMQDYAFFYSSMSNFTTSCPSIPFAPRIMTFFFLLCKLNKFILKSYKVIIVLSILEYVSNLLFRFAFMEQS